jgi:thiol-disulfide isomerase/thioredoxin
VNRRFVTALLVAAVCASCRRSPDEGFTLLFLGRSPAARIGAVSWAPDAARSRLVAFDGQLRVVRTIVNPRLAQPAAVARFPANRLLVTERTGEGVVFDTAGTLVREWESPFSASLYATSDSRVIAARSPYFVLFLAEDGSTPLLWRLDTLGRPGHGLGIIHVPAVPYFAQLVNAGAVALTEDAVYFAPLVRDEILRLDATGYPVWRSSRGLIPVERDPHFAPGRPRRVVHAIVNIAMTIGPPLPGGRLYVLGAQDSAATRLRLDVLNPETGTIINTLQLGTRAIAVAVDRRGTIRVLDHDSLLAQTPTQGREAFFPPFALPDLSGDTVRLEDYRGKVTLVNFWASWCEPCREEFPHMAALYEELGPRGGDFDIAAISDDVSDRNMRAFVREFRPPFRILVGGGRMKATYHYRGLPYSVLLDRQGRVVERIFGFGGDAEFRRLREAIIQELHADAAAGPSIQNPAADWPVYGRDPGGARFSPLTQITRSNVAQLQVAWTYHAGIPDMSSMSHRPPSFEVTPIVVDGTMYLITPTGIVTALDPVAGRQFVVIAAGGGGPFGAGDALVAFALPK